jgi:hypothetical protein
MFKSILLILVLYVVVSSAFFSFKPPVKPAPSAAKVSSPAKSSAPSKPGINKASGRPDPAPEAYVEQKESFITAAWRYNRPVKK